MKVYMAGKISGDDDWRHALVNDLYPECIETIDWNTTLVGAVDGGWDYVGPFYRSFGGHGLEQGPHTHSCGLGPMAASSLVDWNGERYDPFGVTNHLTKAQLFMECRAQIMRADVVFAWLDSLSAHGTLVEIGLARAADKEIWMGGYPIEDLWFAFAAATHVEFAQTADDRPKTVWRRLFNRHGERFRRRKEEDAAVSSQDQHDIAEFVAYAKRIRPNHLRADVWAKTHGACWYCGIEINPFANFHIEHQQPRSKGGSDALDNLVPSCAGCNLSKGSLTLDEYRQRSGTAQFYFERIEAGVLATRD